MKKIHIILFFTLWVIASSCSTYYAVSYTHLRAHET